jgi:hypothetical protein
MGEGDLRPICESGARVVLAALARDALCVRSYAGFRSERCFAFPHGLGRECERRCLAGGVRGVRRTPRGKQRRPTDGGDLPGSRRRLGLRGFPLVRWASLGLLGATPRSARSAADVDRPVDGRGLRVLERRGSAVYVRPWPGSPVLAAAPARQPSATGSRPTGGLAPSSCRSWCAGNDLSWCDSGSLARVLPTTHLPGLRGVP